MALSVRILDREVRYHGFFRLERLALRHERFGGGWTRPMTRELLIRRPAVAVLPYDPVRDEVVLIEQFRAGAFASGRHAGWMREVVAGLLEDGEDAPAVARREAEEEAGLTVGELEPIACFMPSAGGTTEWIDLYCGRVDASRAGGLHGVEEENEDIRATVHPAAEVIAWLDSGLIDNAFTLIALHWLARHRERLRHLWRAA